MATTRVAAVVVLLTTTVLSAGAASGSISAPTKSPTLAFVSGLTGGLALTENGLVQQPLVKTRDVGEFAWSPDGRRIAYVGLGGNLHVVNADGSGLRKLRGKAILSGLAWSPDGRRLAYTGADRGNVHIYVISASGGTPRTLVPGVQGSVLPSWSSRGSIAFTSARTDDARIYSAEADGSRLRTLVRNAADSFPSWSPDGRLLLFQRRECSQSKCGTAVSVIRADGSRRRRVALVPRHPGGNLSAVWSPDGRRIAFERPRAGQFGDEIVVVDVEGSGLRNLTTGVSDASAAAWSPDGRTIAYESSRSIYVMDADGSNKRRFVDIGLRPAWRPTR